MAITQDVYRTQRLVLVRFRRAVTGNPDPECPDIDERNYDAPHRGPLVGIMQGKTIKVKMQRLKIETSAPLFLTSSDTSIVKVADPAAGNLPNADEVEIKLSGEDGGTDVKKAKLQVRHGSLTGPIIHELHVWVFHPLDVDMTPHFVTISHGTNSVAPVADINSIMDLVKAIWVHYGVTFSIGAVQNKTVTLATAGIVSDSPFPGELRTLLANNWPDGTPNWVPNTINAYFVNQIGTGNTLGYGFSRASFGGFGLANPGIILGDRTASSARADVMHWANDLAHEVGHFFRLWHPEQLQPPNEREDTWSRRMLMHNFNLMRGHARWPSGASQFRPRFDDAGYGSHRRGCMITLKNLSQLTTDDECVTTRSTITSTAGPY